MAGIVAEPSVSAVVILDQNGERIAAQYFSDDLQTLHSQQTFERSLLNKALKTSTAGGDSDILMFDGHVAVFRAGRDVYLFVTGDQDENEIILVEVLNALYNTLASLLPGGSVDRNVMSRSSVASRCYWERPAASRRSFEPRPASVPLPPWC
jgi:prepilin-type processing-associated H-X9-DG protein